MNQPVSTVADALINARRLIGKHPSAAAFQARAILNAQPGIAEAYFLLATALRALQQGEEAAEVERNGIKVAVNDPVLMRVAKDLAANRMEQAERLVRRFLQDTPNDPEGLRLLAQIASHMGQFARSQELLHRSLQIAPSFEAARTDLDALIEKQARMPRATSAAEMPPEGTVEFKSALKLNEDALAQAPENPKLWLSYGHVLRIAGRQRDSAAAYRRAVELKPDFGDAWWGLADLKSVCISADEITKIKQSLNSSQIAGTDRIGLHFTLGKALGDMGLLEQSFNNYAAGNSLKRKSVAYISTVVEEYVRDGMKLFSQDFFQSRIGFGSPEMDPIFILGMPRAGSTLVEQILASHPLIEGTEELVYLGNLANIIAGGKRAGLQASSFIESLQSVSANQAKMIGTAYLSQASQQRQSRRPRFTDKMPRNWMYIPLIKLTLPNAKIIDVRRNPLDCCWSNYRQLFADGGEFSYDLVELGNYYRTYVKFMRHLDRALPGYIYSLRYEELVADPKRQVSRMMEFLELPFNEACLQFHNNRRAVKTASSEQVRMPINNQGIGSWKRYEAWLRPLIDALGDELNS